MLRHQHRCLQSGRSQQSNVAASAQMSTIRPFSTIKCCCISTDVYNQAVLNNQMLKYQHRCLQAGRSQQPNVEISTQITLHGLDPSQCSLDVARSKDIYGKLLCAYVALGDEPLPLPDNNYDVLTICGGMGINAVPPEGIYDMRRLVVSLSTSRGKKLLWIEDFKDKLEPMMQQMEADGKWKLLSRAVFSDYLVDKPGVVFTRQVC
ncbi:hypothetical protein RRG08_032431 [Elysia crispata]|uniref:Uncharacterized protein n=1 Tax=Elysia crispata TaxID=231223 RepID=A0AAE0XPA3_9GAST|nr:hypothetical protein RRG08_032431 [Elysia crispata]